MQSINLKHESKTVFYHGLVEIL